VSNSTFVHCAAAQPCLHTAVRMGDDRLAGEPRLDALAYLVDLLFG
jgi:hypothetical protein